MDIVTYALLNRKIEHAGTQDLTGSSAFDLTSAQWETLKTDGNYIVYTTIEGLEKVYPSVEIKFTIDGKEKEITLEKSGNQYLGSIFLSENNQVYKLNVLYNGEFILLTCIAETTLEITLNDSSNNVLVTSNGDILIVTEEI